MKKSLPMIALAVVLVLVILFVHELNNGHLDAPATVTVSEGSGLSVIADTLSEAVNPTLFRLYVMTQGKAEQLRPGTYSLTVGQSYAEILDMLLLGIPDEVTRFTIPEGYELREIRALLDEQGILSADDFDEAVISFDKGEYPFLKGIGKGENRLEGFLFPDTYEVFVGESGESILRRMLDRFSEVWTDEYQARAKELDMTPYEVVILASIIEREAAKASEQAHVSSVFHNRLKRGQLLESCATVQYVLKERKPVLSIADTKIDSPYNTYKYEGLPVGPIAVPGAGAIHAALYPTDDDDYYFFAQPDGTHIFSKTFAEHMRAQGR